MTKISNWFSVVKTYYSSFFKKPNEQKEPEELEKNNVITEEDLEITEEE